MERWINGRMNDHQKQDQSSYLQKQACQSQHTHVMKGRFYNSQ